LETGESLQGEEYRIKTFAVKVENGAVFIELPPAESLDPVMSTEVGCKLATLCNDHSDAAMKCDTVSV
jgi:hypothetical protein